MTPEKLEWKVHTTGIFAEMLSNKQVNACFWIPLNIMRDLLGQVAERAIELNDPELHRLMIRLTLYSMSDPDSEDFNPELVQELLS